MTGQNEQEEALSERGVLIAAEAGIDIRSAADVAEVIGACCSSEGLTLGERELGPEFFDLRSGLAGELFQKVTTYHLRLAIVLPDPGRYGERFGELAYEHRRHHGIRFFRTEGEARAWLAA